MDICGYTCGNLTDPVMNIVLQNNIPAVLQLFMSSPTSTHTTYFSLSSGMVD